MPEYMYINIFSRTKDPDQSAHLLSNCPVDYLNPGLKALRQIWSYQTDILVNAVVDMYSPLNFVHKRS